MTKKLFCILLCTLLLAVTALPVLAEESYNRYNVYGDINDSGEANINDYMMLKRYVLGTYELSQKAWYRSDVNFDGDVDATDYMILKRMVLGTHEGTGADTKLEDMTDGQLYGYIHRQLGRDREEGYLNIFIRADAVGTLADYGLTEGEGVGTYWLGSEYEIDGVLCRDVSVHCGETEICELYLCMLRDENIVSVNVPLYEYPA